MALDALDALANVTACGPVGSLRGRPALREPHAHLGRAACLCTPGTEGRGRD